VDQPLARPARASALYRSADSLWLAHFDGSRQFKLKTPAGGLGQAMWSPDGRQVFYLHSEPGRAHALRQHDPDTGEDKLLASTSQYAAFSCNRDASVLVGASESKAGPYVLLLIRSVRREFALCEHKSAEPARVSPVFTPDSQKIFFQSDRHGKPAIYSMVVDKLVEKTEEEEAELERERNRPSP
jgi:oligogalacturonide lyase